MVPCNLLFPCLDGLSSPFPADEKLTGAIPAKFANLSALGFDFETQATSTDKPVSPNYALGNGVGTGGTANPFLGFGF